MTRPLAPGCLGGMAALLLAAAPGAALADPPPPGTGYVPLAGSCRGPGWDEHGWPRFEGQRTPAECRVLCDDTPGCNGFDLARPDRGRFDCNLFGHAPFEAEGGGDTCFTWMALDPAVRLALVPEAGRCEGPGERRPGERRRDRGPRRAGERTLNEAIALCARTPGCTGFDLDRPRRGRFEVRIFTGAPVRGAGGDSGQCLVGAANPHAPRREPPVYRDPPPERDPAYRDPPRAPAPFDPRSVVKVAGPACPGGYLPVTIGEVDAHRDAVCGRLDRWDVAWLAGGASMDGPGYGCKVRGREERQLGHVLCRPEFAGGGQ
ncbi:MAG: hypothetical protein QM704_11475 [Anaeromyxobacteraceae bacterium]